MKKLLIATGNNDKLLEIKNYFNDFLTKYKISLFSQKDFPGINVIEDGKTIEENALKKAKEFQLYSKIPSLADDTGLFVEALNGEPGVYSARYSGENATYLDNINKLLFNMKGEKNRKAKFITVLIFYDGKNIIKSVGECDGIILEIMSGSLGFGYDPIFFVPEIKKTFSEMTLEEKNSISHRGKALFDMKKKIIKFYENYQ